MKQEVETIHGFDIPKRELTLDEAIMDLTLERIHNFHIQAGEDLADQCGGLIDHKVLAGYLACKYPDLSYDIFEKMNETFSEWQSFKEIYEDDEDEDKFYQDACDFINLTVHCKKRFNQVLIQVAERYS